MKALIMMINGVSDEWIQAQQQGLGRKTANSGLRVQLVLALPLAPVTLSQCMC